MEFSQVFERTLGSESDIVGKELYSFIDHDDKLTLRPEGTAGIVRALINNNMDRDLPKKFYYHGPMFRRERPQKGRLSSSNLVLKCLAMKIQLLILR